jgi:uncharacterized membrane protein
MNQSRTFINSAVASVLALGVAASGGVFAADAAMEKCAGIVKAGQNDCATSTTACHGSVTVDGNQEAWIYVPTGTCDKIVGGHITHQKAPKDKS